jgi:hypothetical protein
MSRITEKQVPLVVEKGWDAVKFRRHLVESVRSDIATSGAWSSVAQPTRLAVPLWTRLTREYLGDVGLHRLRRCKVGITAGCVALFQLGRTSAVKRARLLRIEL